jgi:hypothetical protein
MPQITIRGMEPEIEKKIREMARESGKSLNGTILDMIYKYTGYNQLGRKPANSLRELAGGWSEKDALEIMDSINSFEQIDEEMWK